MKQLEEATDYIKESSKYIYSSILLFLVFALLGFVFRENLSFLRKLLEDIISQTLGLDSFELIFFIMQNNILTALYSILLGAALSIFPIVSAASNGAIIGYVLGISYDTVGIGIWWRLIPHGVFELPAIFISFGLGIKLGFSFILPYFRHYWKRDRLMVVIGALFLPLILLTFLFNKKLGATQFKNLKRNFYKSINTFLMVIIPLLIIAAAIEGLLIGLLR